MMIVGSVMDETNTQIYLTHINERGCDDDEASSFLVLEDVVIHVSNHHLDELHVVDRLRRVFVPLLPHHSDFADATFLRRGDEMKCYNIHL